MHCKILVSNIEQFVYPVEAYGLEHDDINVIFFNPLDEYGIAASIHSALEKEQYYI